MAYLTQERITKARELFISRVLEDTCKFRYEYAGEPVIGDDGIPVAEQNGYRTYKGSEDVPCVVYQSRAFENESLDTQTVVANRFYLEVPVDFSFEDTDHVEKDGRVFEIRKVSGLSRMDMTNEMVIAELMADVDE